MHGERFQPTARPEFHSLVVCERVDESVGGLTFHNVLADIERGLQELTVVADVTFPPGTYHVKVVVWREPDQGDYYVADDRLLTFDKGNRLRFRRNVSASHLPELGWYRVAVIANDGVVGTTRLHVVDAYEPGDDERGR